MTDWIINVVLPYTETVPLEIIVFIFSIIEEIIPPVPAFPVVIVVGSLAAVQDYGFFGVIWLAAVAALGKTVGAVMVYGVVDRLEDVFVRKFGGYFDIAPGDLERFGAKLGNGKRDYIFLTIARAIPFIPSTIISVTSGLLHIPLKLYIITTFLGSVIRDLVYLFAGFYGAEALINHLAGSEEMSSILQWSIIGGVVAILAYFYLRNKRKSASKETTDTAL
jgi:membrane protein DedA with SNARE-associated domain